MKLGWRGSRIWSVLCLSWAEMPAHRGSQCVLKACRVPASMLVSEEKSLAREEKLVLWLLRSTWGIVRLFECLLACPSWHVCLHGGHQVMPSPWAAPSPGLLRAGCAHGQGPSSVQICPCGLHSSAPRETVALTSKFLGSPPFAPHAVIVHIC